MAGGSYQGAELRCRLGYAKSCIDVYSELSSKIGDFVSFVKHMNQTAINNGVDLLLVDTGDLHDGAGLSDATMPNGNVSNAIFENINYYLLAIGNHEL